ncbi:hypothetical protein F5X99DRAFT_432864 [Biscogniauxia marginata]|nr:hypothetical protein F5X99DRAFT_432864 [Biscogniauxia marginata]
MASPSSKEPSETQKSEYDEVSQFFDLDAASLPPEKVLTETLADLLSNVPDSLKFEPITEERTNKFEAWLKDILKRENNSGGNGPYVFSGSADTWFSDDGESGNELPREQGNNETPPKRIRKPTRRVRIDSQLISKIIQQLERS